MKNNIKKAAAISALLGMTLNQAANARITYDDRVADEELTRALTNIPGSLRQLDTLYDQIVDGRKINPIKLGYQSVEEELALANRSTLLKVASYTGSALKSAGGLAFYIALPTGVFLVSRAAINYSMSLVPMFFTTSGGVLASAANNATLVKAAEAVAYRTEDAVQWVSLPIMNKSWQTSPRGPTVEEMQNTSDFNKRWVAADAMHREILEGDEPDIEAQVQPALPSNSMELIAYIKQRYVDEMERRHAAAYDPSWWGTMKRVGSFALVAGQPMLFQWLVPALGLERILFGLTCGPIANFLERQEAASVAFSLSGVAKWVPGIDRLGGWIAGRTAKSEFLRAVNDVFNGFIHLAPTVYNTAYNAVAKIGSWFSWGSSDQN